MQKVLILLMCNLCTYRSVMVLPCTGVPGIRFRTKPTQPENTLMSTRNVVKMATMNIATMWLDFNSIHLSRTMLLRMITILRRSQTESMNELLQSPTSLIINTVYDSLRHRAVVYLIIYMSTTYLYLSQLHIYYLFKIFLDASRLQQASKKNRRRIEGTPFK